MKKKFFGVIGIVAVLSMVGCESNNNAAELSESEVTQNSSLTSSSSSSSISVIQNTSEETSIKSDGAKLEDTETKDYKGLKFECSDKWEYTDNDSSATVTFEPQVKFINIVPTDISEMGEMADTWDALAIESAISGFKSVSDREDYTINVAGEERKAMKCVIGDMSTPVKYTVVSISNEEVGYQFSICYGNAETSENPDDSEFEEFLNSISF